MAEAASISYGNEFSSEPRKSLPSKHIPESSKVRETPWIKYIKVTNTHAPARFWQRNCYDTIIRDTEMLLTIRRYIRDNPLKLKQAHIDGTL